jgi:hypothetical protein
MLAQVPGWMTSAITAAQCSPLSKPPSLGAHVTKAGIRTTKPTVAVGGSPQGHDRRLPVGASLPGNGLDNDHEVHDPVLDERAAPTE